MPHLRGPNRPVEDSECDKATLCSGFFLSESPYVCTVALTPFHCQGTEKNKTMKTIETNFKRAEFLRVFLVYSAA